MKISNAMIEQIKEFEGCSLEAYLDSKGVPTIGIGHTGNDVSIGDKISSEECERLFRKDVSVAEKQVNTLNEQILARTKGGVCLSQCQFDALVSLVYNTGVAAIVSTSTIYKVLMNNGVGDTNNICHAFMLWVKITINGKKEVLGGSDGKHGLVLRRAIESAWYAYGNKWKEELQKRRITDVVEWARS